MAVSILRKKLALIYTSWINKSQKFLVNGRQERHSNWSFRLSILLFHDYQNSIPNTLPIVFTSSPTHSLNPGGRFSLVLSTVGEFGPLIKETLSFLWISSLLVGNFVLSCCLTSEFDYSGTFERFCVTSCDPRLQSFEHSLFASPYLSTFGSNCP